MTVEATLAKHRKWVLGACILLWATALVASHTPGEKLPDLYTSDKVLHVVGFGGLTGIFWLTLTAYGVRPLRRMLILLLVLPAYGAFDELTQPYFQRTCDIHDWIADCAGLILVGAILEIIAFVGRRLRARAG